MTVDTIMGDELDGQLLLPDDPGYDDVRQMWNAMVDIPATMLALGGPHVDRRDLTDRQETPAPNRLLSWAAFSEPHLIHGWATQPVQDVD